MDGKWLYGNVGRQTDGKEGVSNSSQCYFVYYCWRLWWVGQGRGLERFPGPGFGVGFTILVDVAACISAANV